ncbi:ATP-dependent RNA helicase DbpA [Aquabacterium sp. J223]|uniref:ATP-dependent RNA helicase DbpA n=1 Tax=Aquabacterium sp. J223 TaxID=2898431 RepID=UPI0021AE1EDB|nr:ATP-dependent RNA helicase DbpA [Aquabacterium sp. J223]UUX96935.1 ATP-dependent RNA helicase DbpA [Aquabacterium sp. J223]
MSDAPLRTPAATPAAGLSFASLPLPQAVLDNLVRMGFERMTPVQAATLPAALSGRDLIAQARTGSGKTAAFGLPLLQRLDPRRTDVQALVLCPTRELADQVAQDLRQLARAEANLKVLLLTGGAPLRPQAESLAHGAHVVVGTPGRVLDHLSRGHLSLAGLATLVLDEADRMLEMGFAEDIAQVLTHCPARRQTLLFSATYPDGVKALAGRFMREPLQVTLTERPSATQIRQRFYEVTDAQRLHTVGRLLDHFRPASTLAFCNTKRQCRDLVAVLQAEGIVALELHGDLEQRERDQVLVRFANGSASVLVATDIAARGLDIEALAAVVNVDISPDPDVHLHRIGRTGRGDAEGWAFSLASLDEMGAVGRIDERLGRASDWHPLDELTPASNEPLCPPMATLQILGGRKEKIRPGDVLGALTKDLGLPSAQVGRIVVNEFSTYVAVAREVAPRALAGLNAGRVKGRSVKVRRL